VEYGQPAIYQADTSRAREGSWEWGVLGNIMMS
jgi:hypothetical protein